MALSDIKNLLQEHIGLHSETIGDSSLLRAITHRMKAVNIENVDDYRSLLLRDQEELNELVEEVVVPETWFFRNLVPFNTLAKCVPDFQKSVKATSSPLRILSVPCSTGEEPYSIAITLFESGLKEDDFIVDAVDVSKRALMKARRAIYGKHSFRETGEIKIEKYFQKTHSGQQVIPAVRDRVNFIRANIMKDSICPAPEYYDIIFCRNLLIYFDRETQKSVLSKLYAMLRPDGTLFVGHAETSEVGKELFDRVNIPKSFAYRKKSRSNVVDIETIKPVDKLQSIYNQLVEVTLKDIELSKKWKNSSSTISLKKKAKKTPSYGWGRVEKLVEHGRLSEASTLCELLLKDSPEDAQGYYFLGLISSLEGSVGAADSLLKKAIYLDPNHHKALGLSALLAENRGDNETAESLRRREGRARKRSS